NQMPLRFPRPANHASETRRTCPRAPSAVVPQGRGLPIDSGPAQTCGAYKPVLQMRRRYTTRDFRSDRVAAMPCRQVEILNGASRTLGLWVRRRNVYEVVITNSRDSVPGLPDFGFLVRRFSGINRHPNMT